MHIRKYRSADARELRQLFHDTVHHVNKADYTAEQIAAWASDQFDLEQWRQQMAEMAPFVVEHDARLIGYANLQPSGLIDHFLSITSGKEKAREDY